MTSRIWNGSSWTEPLMETAVVPYPAEAGVVAPGDVAVTEGSSRSEPIVEAAPHGVFSRSSSRWRWQRPRSFTTFARQTCPHEFASRHEQCLLKLAQHPNRTEP